MKTLRQLTIAATIFVAAASFSQEVRITGLNTASGQLDYTLAPAEAVSDYSCSVEWRSTLTAGSWTNSWYQPFASFPQTNGMFYAALPRFFRIRCVAGQATNTPPASYSRTVIPSQIENGMIRWTNTNSGLTYYVEQSTTGTDGTWLSQWACQTNIHTTTTVTNTFNVPMFFRVVAIDNGESPF